MSKNKKIIIIVIVCLVLAGGIGYGSYRYSRYKNAEAIREKQQEDRERRKQERQENLKNGVTPTNQIKIPDFKGMTLDEAHKKIESLGITHYMESIEKVNSDLDEGVIVKFTPAHGTSFSEGELIYFTFYISNGNN